MDGAPANRAPGKSSLFLTGCARLSRKLDFPGWFYRDVLAAVPKSVFCDCGCGVGSLPHSLRRSQLSRSMRVISPWNSLPWMTIATIPRLKISISCETGASIGTVTR